MCIHRRNIQVVLDKGIFQISVTLKHIHSIYFYIGHEYICVFGYENYHQSRQFHSAFCPLSAHCFGSSAHNLSVLAVLELFSAAAGSYFQQEPTVHYLQTDTVRNWPGHTVELKSFPWELVETKTN